MARYYIIADRPSVGASLLAKHVNDNAGSQTVRDALRFFASKLAPT